jgi:serine/threonine protein kinase
VDEPGDSSFPNWPEFRRLFAYDNLLGKVVQGRYEIVRRLGAGGMGVVFLARHIHLDKHFALKIISPRFLDEPEIAQRFLLEARAASKIDHVNVVSITDFGPPEDGPTFFAMELLDGEDLAKLIAREGPLPWTRALPIATQIARALAAAHQRGVVHRDIKPQNCVRITRDDNPDFIKVLDFGLAKVLSATANSAWTVGGSPGYIAPEIYRGGKTDHRVDIYALGALLHTLLIGRLPAQTPDDVQLPPGAPILHLADLPPRLRELLARATHEDPAQRHPTAEALVADLETTRAALEHPVPATIPRASRRWPLALAAAALTVPLVLLQLRPGEPAPQPTASRSEQPVPPDTRPVPTKPVSSDTSLEPTKPVPSDTQPGPTEPPVPSDTQPNPPEPPVPSDPRPDPTKSAPPDPRPDPTKSVPSDTPPPEPKKSPPRPPPPFDESAAHALLQRQTDRLAACKADSSFRGVATLVRLDASVTVNQRGRATVTLPPGYDVNACIERLVAGLQFKPSATGGTFDHLFLL